MLKKLYKNIVPEKMRVQLRSALQKSVYPFYLGNNVYCNCCNKSFRKFRSYGNVKRDNAKCPYCFSFERTRVLDLFLQNELDIYSKKDLKILHFAPEPALFKKFSKLDIEYIDGDINPANARFIIDITNIPYQENYFDLIICNHVLGHIPDEQKALSELFRVLKPDGVAIVMSLMNLNSEITLERADIVTPADRLKYYGEHDLSRLYGMDHKNRLESGGFKVDMIDYRKKLSNLIVEKNCLGNGEREMIFKCEKSF